jgi:hypothetical protein
METRVPLWVLLSRQFSTVPMLPMLEVKKEEKRKRMKKDNKRWIYSQDSTQHFQFFLC